MSNKKKIIEVFIIIIIIFTIIFGIYSKSYNSYAGSLTIGKELGLSEMHSAHRSRRNIGSKWNTGLLYEQWEEL